MGEVPQEVLRAIHAVASTLPSASPGQVPAEDWEGWETVCDVVGSDDKASVMQMVRLAVGQEHAPPQSGGASGHERMASHDYVHGTGDGQHAWTQGIYEGMDACVPIGLGAWIASERTQESLDTLYEVHDVQGGKEKATYLTESIIRARYGSSAEDMLEGWRGSCGQPAIPGIQQFDPAAAEQLLVGLLPLDADQLRTPTGTPRRGNPFQRSTGHGLGQPGSGRDGADLELGQARAGSTQGPARARQTSPGAWSGPRDQAGGASPPQGGRQTPEISRGAPREQLRDRRQRLPPMHLDDHDPNSSYCDPEAAAALWITFKEAFQRAHQRKLARISQRVAERGLLARHADLARAGRAHRAMPMGRHAPTSNGHEAEEEEEFEQAARCREPWRAQERAAAAAVELGAGRMHMAAVDVPAQALPLGQQRQGVGEARSEAVQPDTVMQGSRDEQHREHEVRSEEEIEEDEAEQQLGDAPLQEELIRERRRGAERGVTANCDDEDDEGATQRPKKRPRQLPYKDPAAGSKAAKRQRPAEGRAAVRQPQPQAEASPKRTLSRTRCVASAGSPTRYSSATSAGVTISDLGTGTPASVLAKLSPAARTLATKTCSACESPATSGVVYQSPEASRSGVDMHSEDAFERRQAELSQPSTLPVGHPKIFPSARAVAAWNKLGRMLQACQDAARRGRLAGIPEPALVERTPPRMLGMLAGKCVPCPGLDSPGDVDGNTQSLDGDAAAEAGRRISATTPSAGKLAAQEDVSYNRGPAGGAPAAAAEAGTVATALEEGDSAVAAERRTTASMPEAGNPATARDTVVASQQRDAAASRVKSRSQRPTSGRLLPASLIRRGLPRTSPAKGDAEAWPLGVLNAASPGQPAEPTNPQTRPGNQQQVDRLPALTSSSRSVRSNGLNDGLTAAATPNGTGATVGTPASTQCTVGAAPSGAPDQAGPGATGRTQGVSQSGPQPASANCLCTTDPESDEEERRASEHALRPSEAPVPASHGEHPTAARASTDRNAADLDVAATAAARGTAVVPSPAAAAAQQVATEADSAAEQTGPAADAIEYPLPSTTLSLEEPMCAQRISFEEPIGTQLDISTWPPPQMESSHAMRTEGADDGPAAGHWGSRAAANGVDLEARADGNGRPMEEARSTEHGPKHPSTQEDSRDDQREGKSVVMASQGIQTSQFLLADWVLGLRQLAGMSLMQTAAVQTSQPHQTARQALSTSEGLRRQNQQAGHQGAAVNAPSAPTESPLASVNEQLVGSHGVHANQNQGEERSSTPSTCGGPAEQGREAPGYMNTATAATADAAPAQIMESPPSAVPVKDAVAAIPVATRDEQQEPADAEVRNDVTALLPYGSLMPRGAPLKDVRAWLGPGCPPLVVPSLPRDGLDVRKTAVGITSWPDVTAAVLGLLHGDDPEQLRGDDSEQPNGDRAAQQSSNEEAQPYDEVAALPYSDDAYEACSEDAHEPHSEDAAEPCGEDLLSTDEVACDDESPEDVAEEAAEDYWLPAHTVSRIHDVDALEGVLPMARDVLGGPPVSAWLAVVGAIAGAPLEEATRLVAARSSSNTALGKQQQQEHGDALAPSTAALASASVCNEAGANQTGRDQPVPDGAATPGPADEGQCSDGGATVPAMLGGRESGMQQTGREEQPQAVPEPPSDAPMPVPPESQEWDFVLQSAPEFYTQPLG